MPECCNCGKPREKIDLSKAHRTDGLKLICGDCLEKEKMSKCVDCEHYIKKGICGIKGAIANTVICYDFLKSKQPKSEPAQTQIRQFETKVTEIERFGHPDFYKLLDQMAQLHSCKNHDYAGTKDPLKNLRACERLNLEPFLGVLVRLQDKWSRLEEFVNSGQLLVKNESVIDTLMDNAVYSLLAIILYQEQQKKSEEK